MASRGRQISWNEVRVGRQRLAERFNVASHVSRPIRRRIVVLSEVLLERGDARALGAPHPWAHKFEERPALERTDGTEVATQCRDPAGHVNTATWDGRKRVDRGRDDLVHDASGGQRRW